MSSATPACEGWQNVEHRVSLAYTHEQGHAVPIHSHGGHRDDADHHGKEGKIHDHNHPAESPGRGPDRTSSGDYLPRDVGRQESRREGERRSVMAEQQTTSVMEREKHAPTIFEQMEQEFSELRRRMADVFRRPFAPLYGPPLPREAAWAPRADAYQADGGLVIKAELPGVKKDDIRLTVGDGVLTIQGTRQEEKEVKEGRSYMAERFSGSFARSFALPEGVDTNAITAAYNDGVLEVRVPLPAQAKTEATTIPIAG